MTILAMALALLLQAGQAGRETSGPKETELYSCVAEKSTGFVYDAQSKEWQPRTLQTDTRLIIEGAGKSFGVINPDLNDELVAVCPGGFDRLGVLLCTGAAGGQSGDRMMLLPGQLLLKFNKRNGRFVLALPGGFVHAGLPRSSPLLPEMSDDKVANPRMEIGKCSPL